MHQGLRSALKMVAVAAGIVAALPYFRFLAGPPPEQARSWLVTVVALGIAAGTAFLLHRTRRPRT